MTARAASPFVSHVPCLQKCNLLPKCPRGANFIQNCRHNQLSSKCKTEVFPKPQNRQRAAKKGAIRFTPQLGIFVVLWLIEKQNRVIRSNCQELCFHRETRISGLKKAEPLTVELIKYVSEPLPMLDLLFQAFYIVSRCLFASVFQFKSVMCQNIWNTILLTKYIFELPPTIHILKNS